MGKVLSPEPLLYQNNLALQASKRANRLEEIICTAMAALHTKYPNCHLHVLTSNCPTKCKQAEGSFPIASEKPNVLKAKLALLQPIIKP